MSKQVALLEVEARSDTGKGAARRLRAAGKVPGVVYGHGEDPMAVQADELELQLLINRISVENTLIDLKVGGSKPKAVLIREIQRHPYRSKLLHVDFFEITAGEKIKVGVPIRLEGTPAGVRVGGILQVIRYELEVECLPREIPEVFEVDISDMEIGDSLHISEIDTGDVTLLEDESLTVCTVVAPKVAAVEEEEAEEAEEEEGEVEPEVITARGDEGSEQED
jgi:large subunit ribosomal protein L25